MTTAAVEVPLRSTGVDDIFKTNQAGLVAARAGGSVAKDPLSVVNGGMRSR
jgi:hypothetical protein